MQLFITFFYFSIGLKFSIKKGEKQKQNTGLSSVKVPSRCTIAWMNNYFSNPLLDDGWNLQKECPSHGMWDIPNSPTLIVTSSPQPCLSRNHWGWVSNLNVHTYFLQEDSQTLLTNILWPPLHDNLASCSFSWGKNLQTKWPGKVSHEAKNRQSRWKPPHHLQGVGR